MEELEEKINLKEYDISEWEIVKQTLLKKKDDILEDIEGYEKAIDPDLPPREEGYKAGLERAKQIIKRHLK